MALEAIHILLRRPSTEAAAALRSMLERVKRRPHQQAAVCRRIRVERRHRAQHVAVGVQDQVPDPGPRFRRASVPVGLFCKNWRPTGEKSKSSPSGRSALIEGGKMRRQGSGGQQAVWRLCLVNNLRAVALDSEPAARQQQRWPAAATPSQAPAPTAGPRQRSPRQDPASHWWS